MLKWENLHNGVNTIGISHLCRIRNSLEPWEEETMYPCSLKWSSQDQNPKMYVLSTPFASGESRTSFPKCHLHGFGFPSLSLPDPLCSKKKSPGSSIKCYPTKPKMHFIQFLVTSMNEVQIRSWFQELSPDFSISSQPHHPHHLRTYPSVKSSPLENALPPLHFRGAPPGTRIPSLKISFQSIFRSPPIICINTSPRVDSRSNITLNLKFSNITYNFTNKQGVVTTISEFGQYWNLSTTPQNSAPPPFGSNSTFPHSTREKDRFSFSLLVHFSFESLDSKVSIVIVSQPIPNIIPETFALTGNPSAHSNLALSTKPVQKLISSVDQPPSKNWWQSFSSFPSKFWLGFSGIIGVYTVFVLGVGRFLRMGVSGLSHLAMYEDMPDVDRLLEHCKVYFPPFLPRPMPPNPNPEAPCRFLH